MWLTPCELNFLNSNLWLKFCDWNFLTKICDKSFVTKIVWLKFSVKNFGTKIVWLSKSDTTEEKKCRPQSDTWDKKYVPFNSYLSNYLVQYSQMGQSLRHEYQR